MITAGIDMGSKTIKVVILKDGEIIGKALEIAGFDSRTAAEKAFAAAMGEAGISIEDIGNVAEYLRYFLITHTESISS